MGDRIVVLMASHNRREQTLACLASLAAQRDVEAQVDVVLVDDASPDGTAAAVAEAFPSVSLVAGTGELYWNGGMRRAFEVARESDPDDVLWLNDDVVLDPTALSTLLQTRAQLQAEAAVVAGAVRDPESGEVTYGGLVRRDRRRPLRFELVDPGPEPVEVDTMHGNCVLIPREVHRAVGNLDPGYRHAMGDFDYGLRARRAGFPVWLAPGTVGTCPGNPGQRLDGRPLREQLQALTSVKGLPPADWRTFAQRWAGPAWPLYWASPYLRRTLRLVTSR
jgi:GT2 family glycosyltransferase